MRTNIHTPTLTSGDVTELEAKILHAIAHHEMNPENGARPLTHTDVATWSWADDFARAAGVSVNVAKGAMGSLTSKGMLSCDGTHRDAVVSFTEKGFAAFVAAYPLPTK